MMPAVAVVVPTYRRDDLLARCLERLLDQSLSPAEYEIIVCDDGPSESTRRLVENLRSSGRPTLRYLAITATQGPAAARNAGWRSSTAPIVAFTDDDCLPDERWLEEGVAAIRTADAVTGRTIVPLSPSPTDYERDTAGLATAEFITANCFCRRKVLKEIGGFDERFTTAWREDSDLHFTLLERRKQIVRADRAVVVHPVRSAPWGVSLKQQAKGAFDLLLKQKHPHLYAQRIPPFPRLYYVACAGLAGMIVAAVCRSEVLLVACLTVWLVATLAFAGMRLKGSRWTLSHILEMLVTSALIPPLSLYWRVVGLLRFGPQRRFIRAASEQNGKWDAGVMTP
jgi:glycosyltransferase involved in cell wall biosynthesis